VPRRNAKAPQQIPRHQVASLSHHAPLPSDVLLQQAVFPGRSLFEATEEYQLEQRLKELEDRLDALDAIAQEADERNSLSL
jgi:hypothetical protein